MTRDFKFETLQLHAGQVVDPATKSRAVPIYQTTSFVFDDTQEGADLFALRKPGISILVSPTLQQLPLKKELLPLKVVLELLQQHQVWPRLLIQFWRLHMLVIM